MKIIRVSEAKTAFTSNQVQYWCFSLRRLHASLSQSVLRDSVWGNDRNGSPWRVREIWCHQSRLPPQETDCLIFWTNTHFSYLDLFYVFECFVCMCLCLSCVCLVPSEIKKGTGYSGAVVMVALPSPGVICCCEPPFTAGNRTWGFVSCWATSLAPFLWTLRSNLFWGANHNIVLMSVF